MTSANSIEDAIFKHPLLLLEITDDKVRRTIDKYLPFSTGFEIECGWLDESLDSQRFSEFFRSIPDILDINCDRSEQRFRIPEGLKGLICLYHISEKLKKHCHITTSGIHYHIDMTEWYDEAEEYGVELVENSKEWFLKELDTWNYAGKYNSRLMDTFNGNRYWVRFKSISKTCEIRIGEMTFDYEILVKRIIHANKIVRRLKGELFKVKKKNRLKKLKKDLEEMEGIEEVKDTIPNQDELNILIKKRQIKLK